MTATIYTLAGRILRDHVRATTRTARFLAASRRASVIVEDWAACRRYRVTRTGAIRRPPRYWLPASVLAPDPSIRAMRADPARYSRELELHRIDILMRAKYRAWYRTWQRRQARLKRRAHLIEDRLAATIAADKARAALEVMAR